MSLTRGWIAVLSVVACITAVRAISWSNCDGTSAKGVVKNLVVAGCETTPVCPLKKGTNASIEIDFIPSEDSATAKSVVHGIVAGIPMPFPLPNDNVCKDSGVQCPLKNGSPYNYKTQIYVSPSYPSISVKVRWEIQDPNSNDLICIEMKVKLVSSNKTPKGINL